MPLQSGSLKALFAVMAVVLIALGLLSVAAAGRTRKSLARVEVENVKPSPGFWSGPLTATQWVDLHVLQQVGVCKSRSISVGITLVAGSSLSDKHEPKVNSQLFKKGTGLLLRCTPDCLRPQGEKTFLVTDDKCIQRINTESRK